MAYKIETVEGNIVTKKARNIKRRMTEREILRQQLELLAEDSKNKAHYENVAANNAHAMCRIYRLFIVTKTIRVALAIGVVLYLFIG